MNNKTIKLLDCTLRDGGYVNDWNFGHSVISGTYKRLDNSGIDFIEVGFLDDRREFDINRTIFPNTESLNKIFDSIDIKNAVPVAMIDFGTCDIENIAEAKDSFIKGIRVIFKKEKIEQALPFCEKIKEKGYLLSIQAISITAYSDEDMLNYIEKINKIKPYAFSIVDTYGLLDSEKLEHYFRLINENLDSEICLGYHSHNNFQLAFSNTIAFVKMFDGRRNLIADSTVYGMGKSAGNCPTELLAMHMNNNYAKKYDLNMILEIIDTDIMTIYKQQYWGYKYNFYIAAMQNCHPNYVQYLLDKKTLSVSSINSILSAIPDDKKLLFDEKYIVDSYKHHQKNVIDDTYTYEKLSYLKDRNIVLIGPGTSIKEYSDDISTYINDNDSLVISVNFLPEEYNCHYTFVSNSKRYLRFADNVPFGNETRLIATSNIQEVDYPIDMYFNYESLLLDSDNGSDNALLLLLNALIKLGVKSVSLAGFDGFDSNRENYYNLSHCYVWEDNSNTNDFVSNILKILSDSIKINFITPTLYDIGECDE